MGGNFAAVIAQEHRKSKAPVLQLLIYPGLDLVSETPSMHEFRRRVPADGGDAGFLPEALPAGQSGSQRPAGVARTH
jgi:acetyl esterase/lipase